MPHHPMATGSLPYSTSTPEQSPAQISGSRSSALSCHTLVRTHGSGMQLFPCQLIGLASDGLDYQGALPSQTPSCIQSSSGQSNSTAIVNAPQPLPLARRKGEDPIKLFLYHQAIDRSACINVNINTSMTVNVNIYSILDVYRSNTCRECCFIPTLHYNRAH